MGATHSTEASVSFSVFKKYIHNLENITDSTALTNLLNVAKAEEQYMTELIEFIRQHRGVVVSKEDAKDIDVKRINFVKCVPQTVRDIYNKRVNGGATAYEEDNDNDSDELFDETPCPDDEEDINEPIDPVNADGRALEMSWTRELARIVIACCQSSSDITEAINHYANNFKGGEITRQTKDNAIVNLGYMPNEMALFYWARDSIY